MLQGRRQLNRWCDSMRSMPQAGKGTKQLRGGGRKDVMYGLASQLETWFRERRAKIFVVRLPALLQKATELADGPQRQKIDKKLVQR